MPMARALTTFNGRYGTIRKGVIFNCDPNYFRALLRNKMVEETTDQPEPDKKPEPGPSKDRNVPAAPGKAQAGDGVRTPAATDPRPAGGMDVTSRSLRLDLPSRRQTSRRLAVGDAATKQESPPDA